MHTLTIPSAFWVDHCERDCTPADTERRVGNRWIVTLSDEALADLESDARHYATAFGGEEWGRDPYGRTIIRSARRTLEIITAYRKA